MTSIAWVDWVECRFPLGQGLVTLAGGICWEIIPYASEDGTGRVAGFAVRAEKGLALTRVPGPIAAAIAEAERRIGERERAETRGGGP